MSAPEMVLGVETSCDETAAAVVQHGRFVLSNVVASQVDLHAPFGGVFPELASRQHVRDVVPVVLEALGAAGADWPDLSAVAVTRGPGLSGSLLVGVNVAKGMAMAAGLPLVGVNHLEGHLYSNWLHDHGVLRTGPRGPAVEPPLPHLALIVSGGHTDLVAVRDHGDYTLLGATLDDAAGEAFDKAARTLGLGYPGGPALERAAVGGDPRAFSLPVAVTDSPLDFSFSGLKSAVLRIVRECEERGADVPIADLAASFQDAVARALVSRVTAALDRFEPKALLVAGGVSANATVRAALESASPVPLFLPPLELCTDNAAMIACAGYWRLRRGAEDDLALDVDSSLRLDDLGAGVA